MATHNITGKKGEAIAFKYLQQNNYNILERNWKAGNLEIDIVAIDKKEIVIVEVKTRTDTNYDNARMALTDKKIRNIVIAGEMYIHKHNINLAVRFDIILIITNGQKYQLQHIKDAFLSPIW